MPIYISHVTLIREGLQELKEAPNRVQANRELWEPAGGKLLHLVRCPSEGAVIRADGLTS